MEFTMGKESKSRYALLGMLSLAPLSGYDLKKLSEYSIGHFWNESYPQIYPMLKQLANEGLATSQVERQEGKPDRHVYTLTETGWDELSQWLIEPFESQIERNELLLKLFFGGLVQIPVSIGHVRRHRAMQERLLHLYEQTEAELRATREQDLRHPYWLMTLSYGRHIAHALLDWCDETLATLERMAQDAQKNKEQI
jgi:DNA-binding PadR family transcriptional regulator